jgi:hypothetical protein
VLNLHSGCRDADDATRHSLIGTHVIIEAHDAEFVSLLEPPDELAAAAQACSQHRIWPVLGGEAGDTDLLLGLPIALDDHPEIAAESRHPAAGMPSSAVAVDPASWPGLPDIVDGHDREPEHRS